jgi:hypothetical protein
LGIQAQFNVVRVDKPTAKILISQYHYLGNKGFRYGVGYGLQDKHTKEVVGVAVFHSPSAPETMVGAFGLERHQQEGFWELGRFVLKQEYNGGNFGSYLLGNAIKLLRIEEICRAIITYADSSLHYGALYQATNFTYCGLTDKKKDFWILKDGQYKKQERGKTKGVAGEWRDRPQKHRYISIFDKTLNLKWEVQPYIKSK